MFDNFLLVCFNPFFTLISICCYQFFRNCLCFSIWEFSFVHSSTYPGNIFYCSLVFGWESWLLRSRLVWLVCCLHFYPATSLVFSHSGVLFLTFLLLMVFSVGLILKWLCVVGCLFYYNVCLAFFYGVFYSFCSSSLPVVMCFYKTALEGLFPWPVFHSLSSHSWELLSVGDNTEEINGDTEPQLVKDCRQTVNVLRSHRGKRWEHYLKARIMQFVFLVLCLLLIFNACHKVIAIKRMARKVTAAFLWLLFYLIMRVVVVCELSSKYYLNPMGGWVGGKW